ncbi:MAG: ubiquinone biosynthesis methyltransferase UbiE [Stygiobacter sp. RIFOXYC12_FULL_38_8]|nr:MAG: ubiquinone biosynthesis methyltransferase UbiE [Stygiobacter sp. GWC2_38_9]OGV08329.1 MAG: ubiquinone biosynthesis methyltransferase UbiE [Stygiobacter sp. RIFOXYB2_FULL_37_11]OGV12156.1 MAG: ubiquinone biosynthesis methyltransferase UbiE [Stygiobacter sp. RIFOXYC2_FULL_38_25]OGV12203.1 MAG: ubiquinone biosynthesis methyltransferase UbiE [Stygiobacter sp. RIFOXYA2_FULL_38_8]OGV24193.1 MAG: ubiquinone biosynthesis methyltransferase UbiE [Stygiobacter sp. RIFOXYC12_FULL_38_8]OGV81282.1 M
MEEPNKKVQVRRIFDSISHRYDFLNHFLSAGVDFYWRKKAIKLSKMSPDSVLLDLACGTGDFAITAKNSGVQKIFGGDLSYNMLSLFGKKADWINGRMLETVAEHLPFQKDSFTNITVAFGVRNFYDIPTAFKEFNRVLANKGKATVLEFRLPENKLVRNFYMLYFNKILPLIGRIISSNQEAYTYLPESVGEFDKKVDLVKIFSDCGFANVKKYSLTFGLVQVVIAEK